MTSSVNSNFLRSILFMYLGTEIDSDLATCQVSPQSQQASPVIVIPSDVFFTAPQQIVQQLP